MPGRCKLHGLGTDNDGQCVICRRSPATEKSLRQEWSDEPKSSKQIAFQVIGLAPFLPYLLVLVPFLLKDQHPGEDAVMSGFLFFLGLGIVGWFAAFWKLSENYGPHSVSRNSTSSRRLVVLAVVVILLPFWLGPVVMLIEKIYVAIVFRR
jgi:hypothetical protein